MTTKKPERNNAVTVKVSAEELEAAHEVAAKLDVTLAQLVRRLLRDAHDDYCGERPTLANGGAA